MAKTVFGRNQSLDGYVDHEGFAPDPALACPASRYQFLS